MFFCVFFSLHIQITNAIIDTTSPVSLFCITTLKCCESVPTHAFVWDYF